VSGRCQERLDHALVGVWSGIRFESPDLLGRRWETDEVEVDPSDPDPAGCLRVGIEARTLESIEDEGIDRVPDPVGVLRGWEGLGFRGQERPMVLGWCPGDGTQGQRPDQEAGPDWAPTEGVR
jgi:hypothetical protein